jgi:Flp pilus assembly pilin Flp
MIPRLQEYQGFLFSGLSVPAIQKLDGDPSVKILLVRLWREDEGQDLTEYALLLVLLTLAAIGSLGALANAVNGVFLNAAANLNTPT